MIALGKVLSVYAIRVPTAYWLLGPGVEDMGSRLCILGTLTFGEGHESESDVLSLLHLYRLLLSYFVSELEGTFC